MSDNGEQIFGGGGIIDKWNDTSVRDELDEIKAMLQNIGGGVKAVYRGITTGAQTVELPAAVNMNKSFIYSVSKGSAGYVAARGDLNLPNYMLYGWDGYNSNSIYSFDLRGDANGVNITHNNTTNSNKMSSIRPNGNGNISGGSTNLTVKEYSARLIDETHIQTDGAVEWQVIEYN